LLPFPYDAEDYSLNASQIEELDSKGHVSEAHAPEKKVVASS
jgi:hypothetical protein